MPPAVGAFLWAVTKTIILNVVTNKLFGPKQRSNSASPTYTFMRTQANSNLPVPIIYGKKVRAYGNIIWQTEGSTIYSIVGICQGKIKGISNVRINNIPIAQLPGCSYTAYVGDGIQEIDSRVPGATQADKARVVGGLKYDAYIALTLVASDRINSNFTLSCDVDGKIVRIYSDLATYTEDSAENPIWNILDFYTNHNGCQLPRSKLILPTFLNEAAYCDATVDGQPRFTMNLVLDERKARGDWLNDMFLTCRASQLYQNGKYGVFIRKAQSVAQPFTIAKNEDFKILFSKNNEVFDKVNVRYIDPNYEWTKVPAPAEVPKAERRVKRDKTVTKNIDIFGITNFKQASRQAWYYSNESNAMTMWAYYRTNRKASNRTAGDVIQTTDQVFGIVNKKWWVEETGLDENGYVAMVLREYNEALFADTMGSVAPTVNVTTHSNPYAVPPAVTGLTLEEYEPMNTSNVAQTNLTVSWNAVDFPGAVQYLITISDDNGMTWRTAGYARESPFRITGIKAGEWYLVGIQAQTRAMVLSPRTTAGISTLGFRMPLPNVQNISIKYENGYAVLTWPIVSDFRSPIYYVVKKGGASAPAGQIYGSFNTPDFFIPGNDTYWISAAFKVTINGTMYVVYSAEWARVDITGARINQNIVAEYDEAATGWSGTLSGQAIIKDNAIQLGGDGLISDVADISLVNNMLYPDGSVSGTGTYQIPVSHRPTVAADQIVNISVTYHCAGVNITSSFDQVASVDALPDWDGSEGLFINALPQINVYCGGVWQGWKDFFPGQYYGNDFDLRIILTSSDPQVTPSLSAFSFKADVQQRTENGNVTVPAAGCSVLYQQPFNDAPTPTITIFNAQAGDEVKLTNQTVSGFTIQVINAGVGLERQINYNAPSY